MQAGTVIVRGLSGKVAGRLVRAAGHFVRVAYPVAVGVVEAVAIAIHKVGFGIGAGRIDRLGHAIATEGQAEGQVVNVVALREDLDVDRSAHFTIGGELTEEDGAIRGRHAVGVAIEDVPHATDGIVHDDVAARGARTGIEGRHPRLPGGLDRGGRVLPCRSIGRSFESDGDPAVIGEVGVHREQQWVDRLGSRTAQDVLEEIGGRRNVEGVVGVAVDGRHKVGRVLGVQQDLIGRHAGQVTRRVILDDPELHAVSVVGRGRHERQGVRIVVAGLGIIAGLGLDVVTNAVAVDIGRAVAAADSNGVGLVAVTIAVAVGNVRTSAIVDGAGTVADATGIHIAHAIVDIVANAVGVSIRRAVATAVANGVQDVAIAITGAVGDVVAPAIPGCTGAIADATLVHHTNAVVHIVTDAVRIRVGGAGAAAHAEGIGLVAIAVAIPIRDGLTSAVVDGAGAVADATGIHVAHAVVDVIADSISVRIGCAVTAARTEGVVIQAVVVASGGTAHAQSERQVEQQVVLVVSLREDLDLHVAGQFAIGGELAEQDTAIGVGHAIGIPVQDVPHAAHNIIDGDVGSRHPIARIEEDRPALAGRLDHTGVRLPSRDIRRTIDADGDPAVIGQVREGRQQQRVDVGRGRPAQHMLVEGRGRLDVGRVV